jgi:prevent-host-death family protein
LNVTKCYFSITRMRSELVTTLKRKATKILSQLQKDKAPILITQHGKPTAYLVDVKTYEELQRRLAVLQGIARGERSIDEGRTLSQAQAKRRMFRWLK